MNWCITIATPRGLRHRLQSKNTLKSFITASGVIHALAMFRQRCSLNSSANSRRRLETRVSAIDSTPQIAIGQFIRWTEVDNGDFKGDLDLTCAPFLGDITNRHGRLIALNSFYPKAAACEN